MRLNARLGDDEIQFDWHCSGRIFSRSKVAIMSQLGATLHIVRPVCDVRSYLHARNGAHVLEYPFWEIITRAEPQRDS